MDVCEVDGQQGGQQLLVTWSRAPWSAHVLRGPGARVPFNETRTSESSHTDFAVLVGPGLRAYDKLLQVGEPRRAGAGRAGPSSETRTLESLRTTGRSTAPSQRCSWGRLRRVQ